ncbi:uncharacterized protein JCM10292_004193 [Rhodotorula paludigena]|uniref:uncharacterized protein n=1 Tax=Rhodotorula paludigena TaxID=86838 RepID=UPI00316D6942
MAPGSPRSPRSPSRRPNLSVVVEEPLFDDDYADDDLAAMMLQPGASDPLLPGRAIDASLSSDSLDGADSFDEKTGLPYAHSRSAKRQEAYGWARRSDAATLRPARHVKTLVLLVVAALFSIVFYLASTEMTPGSGLLGGASSRWSATLLVHETTNASLTDWPPNYNPLFPKKPIEYDYNVFVEFMRSSISASEPSAIIFHCRHDDVALCAPAYRVLFVGPTMHSPLHQKSRVLDDRRVEVTFDAVRDPGWYQVFAWPEHDTCDQWNHGETKPYHMLAVSGTPRHVEVVGEQPLDYARECMASDDLTDGRWVSKAYVDLEHHDPDSPFYNWLESHLNRRQPKGLTDYSSFEYIWAPYQCKPHHRSFDEWIETVKPERLVVFGDSVMRDLFCQTYLPDHEICQFVAFGNYEQSDKYIKYTRTDGGISHLHFHWEPEGEPTRLTQFLTTLDTPATHIFFNVALWLTRNDPRPESYVVHMKLLLDALVKAAPNAKIVARTSAGAVQSVACFDLWRIQRRILEPVNAGLLKLLESYPTIQPLDVYPIYNDRPDATQDGRHWQRLSRDANDRPEEGAVGYAMTDLIFEGWRLQAEEDNV